jgi:hypothetical protein
VNNKFFTLTLLLVGLSLSWLLKAESDAAIEISSKSYKGYEAWAKISKSSGEPLKIIKEELPFLTNVLPGMSLQTQWLDPRSRVLLAKTIMRPDFELSLPSEIEKRWILMEDKLLPLPGELQNLAKTVYFVKAASDLGASAHKNLSAKISGPKRALANNRRMDFFFYSDAKRQEYISSGKSSKPKGSALSKVLMTHLRDKSSLKNRFKSLKDEEMEAFCNWVVSDVYAKITEPKHKKIEIMHDIKAKFSSSNNALVLEKFKISIANSHFIDLLKFLSVNDPKNKN